MVFWMACIQINREKYETVPEVYRDELRKVKARYKPRSAARGGVRVPERGRLPPVLQKASF